jgi:hypothetical protein
MLDKDNIVAKAVDVREMTLSFSPEKDVMLRLFPVYILSVSFSTSS